MFDSYLENIYELNIDFNMYANVVITVFFIYFIFAMLLNWKASIVQTSTQVT